MFSKIHVKPGGYKESIKKSMHAVVQESREGYLKLSMKYRRLTLPVSNRISVDIFPIRADAPKILRFFKIGPHENFYRELKKYLREVEL